MNKIWIVKASSEQYDDWWSWNVISFSTEQAAQDYIAAQPEVNYDASKELQELQTKYCSVFYETSNTDDFTDKQWEEWYEKEEQLNQKAFAEIQIKYPHANLSLDYDFNGYTIDSIEFGG